tara:strand:+ start:968 stop:1291 length:324 start_codon:yes stop_codon:yes gene_type:complete
MSVYAAPILFILFLGGGYLCNVQTFLKDDNHVFLRSHNMTNDSLTIAVFPDDDIEVYENDDYSLDYSVYYRSKPRETNIQNNNSDVVNDKQVDRYFYEKYFIDLWRR